MAHERGHHPADWSVAPEGAGLKATCGDYWIIFQETTAGWTAMHDNLSNYDPEEPARLRHAAGQAVVASQRRA